MATAAAMKPLVLHVAPRLDPGGFHRDRFDAYLGGELLYTGRQLLRPAARKLIERGYPPETLLTMWAEGASGASFRPRTLAAWAGEMLSEADDAGFRVTRWKEPPKNAARRCRGAGKNAQLAPEGTEAA